MDLQAIYVKTAKGQEELATRAYQLPSRVRTLLVMVDGTASGEYIVETTATLGNSAAFFSLLVDEGFIAAVAPSAKSAASASALNMPPKELVRFASRLVTELLGPAGDSLTLRLEKARSVEEFANHVEQCRDVIANSLGKSKGDQFWNAVAAQLSA